MSLINWLTSDNPEEYLLTFSVRNNFTVDLPHGLTNSTWSVEGNSIREWPNMLKKMLNEAGIGEMVKAGQTIEISGKFNDFLKSGIEQQLNWKIGEINYNTDVRFRKF